MTLDKESLRCLRIVAKSGAELETPLRSGTMRFLLDRGLIKEARKYRAAWGGRMHDVVQLAVTKEGKAALDANT